MKGMAWDELLAQIPLPADIQRPVLDETISRAIRAALLTVSD